MNFLAEALKCFFVDKYIIDTIDFWPSKKLAEIFFIKI